MFTFYMDDSGTDPSQHVAIATALVIPAMQIIRLDSEWETFRDKEKFGCFHTSEFYFRNKKSDFRDWDDDKQKRVFARVQQISKKYGVRAVSVAVNKKDYDEVVPAELRGYLGKDHYSWAIRQLLANLSVLYPATVDRPREFIFQWIERRNPVRKEIEVIMDQMQYVSEKEGAPADYSDPHFRKSDGIPGLQCVDAISWVSYQFACLIYRNIPLRKFVPEWWEGFGGNLGDDGWLRAVTVRRENLERTIKEDVARNNARTFFREWSEARGR